MGKNSIIGNKRYLLFLGDIIILYFCLWLTLIIRYQKNYDSTLWASHFWPFTVVFFIWLTIFYINEIYELKNYRQGQAGFLSRLLAGMIIGLIISATFFYIGQDRLFTIKPQRVLLIDSLITVVLVYLWHTIFNRLIKSSMITSNVIIIGLNQLVLEIAEILNQKSQLGLQLKLIVVPPNNSNNIPESIKSLTQISDFENLKNLCLDKKINIIISTIHPRENTSLAKNLFSCLPLQINFFDIATFYEKVTGKIPVTTIEQTWFLENLNESNKKVYEKIKRVFEVLFSFLLMIVSALFIPFIALAIKLSSSGPIFFWQQRTGKNGKKFMAIKFRTMVKDAEKNGPQWATKNDPRVTKLGGMMRKTRLDEIPQLINVLRGEMSLIGPRPERPEFIEQLQNQIPFYKERLLVKPGLTGWAQVVGPSYGGSVTESLEKLQYDLFYIKNRSLTLDLAILLKTIKTVLSRKGS